MSVPKSKLDAARRPARKKTVAKPAAAVIQEPVFEIEYEPEYESALIEINTPHGEYWVRFLCPFRDCRTELEIRCFAHPDMYCSHCHTKMKAVAWRKAEE